MEEKLLQMCKYLLKHTYDLDLRSRYRPMPIQENAEKLIKEAEKQLTKQADAKKPR